jgi:hypothetical protein
VRDRIICTAKECKCYQSTDRDGKKICLLPKSVWLECAWQKREEGK